MRELESELEGNKVAEQSDTEFILFPAIDILDGACVRLLKGDYDRKTEYGRHPRAMAERWLEKGARFLHVVDLNAAKSGEPHNVNSIAEVVQAAKEVGANVQVGGGIRSFDAMEQWLNLGVARVVVGTAAQNMEWVEEAVRRFGSDALVVGLDGRDGKLAVHGWLEQTEIRLAHMARELFQRGVKHALVTDVERDGTLEGPNLELTMDVQSSGVQAIVSGGIRNLADVVKARDAGFAGAIAGRSIYDGTLDVREALLALGPQSGGR